MRKNLFLLYELCMQNAIQLVAYEYDVEEQQSQEPIKNIERIASIFYLNRSEIVIGALEQ